jgi:NitT/TauT family transport system permease protein
MIPVLDILQSIPILSFLPAVILALVAAFPHSNIGLELASVLLIFTSQAWNMTFSFYHSAKTLPADLQEVSTIARVRPWRRFLVLELPSSMIGLIWNSMMSWAGGWFFLMASEQFTLGNRSFHLSWLGSYLQAAANAGNTWATLLGLATLIALIVSLALLLHSYPCSLLVSLARESLVEDDLPDPSSVEDMQADHHIVRERCQPFQP